MTTLLSSKTKQSFTDTASCSIGKINCMSAGFRGNVGTSFMSGIRQIQISKREYEVLALGKELLSTFFIKLTTDEDINRWPNVPASKPQKRNIEAIKSILFNERSITPRLNDGEDGENLCTIQRYPNLQQAGHIDIVSQQFFR